MYKTQEKFYSVNGRRLVLIVDQDQNSRQLLDLLLREEYETLLASDGETALKMIREKRDLLSLVLLDLIMPGLHGLDLLQILKNDRELSHLPVIVLTADQDAEADSLHMGAADFIPKPYPNREVILTRVMRAIELSEDRDIIQSTQRDPLTGLYHKEFFDEYAQLYEHHHQGVEMDAMVVDVRHYGMITERYGKDTSNELLRMIGERLRESVQDEGGIVCRQERDTFLVYCPHREDYAAILQHASVDLPGSSESKVRLRMGVYSNVDQTLDMEQRFERARMAADTIRGNYSRKIAFYDNELRESEMYADRLLEDFPRALQERQFIVFYQPKFDIRPQIPVLASAEALVRWEHPELGMISPGLFIPLFEENGMIQQLDLYVWRTAAAQVRDWRDRFGITVPISVNVSRIDMYDPKLIPTFQQLLREFDIQTDELLLEITESAYTQDSDQIIDTVNQLRDLGFRIEMDDFGTGYSSLNMISSLPIDALKLDMKFIREAFRDGQDTRLIEIIIEIAKYLKVPVIAEGVETREQLDVLRGMGCDLIQGYYFSKPIPATEYESFIQDRIQRLVSDVVEVPVQEDAGGEREFCFSIAHALTSGYEVIYYVDIDSGRYVQFTAQGKYEDLQIERSGSDFFADTQKNIPRVVYEEDRERVSQSFKKEVLLAQFMTENAFTMTYRLVIDGRPTYYNMRAVKTSARNDRHIVVGVSNVEEQLRNAGAAGTVDTRNLEFFSIARILSSDYENIYYVDIDTEEYTEFTSQGRHLEQEIQLSGSNFFAECQHNLLSVVYEEDRPAVSKALRKENLLKALQISETFVMLYRLIIDGVPVFYRMKIAMAEDQQHIAIGVSNVEAQMAQEQEYEDARRNGLNFSAITNALAADYLTFYYVDMETEDFVELSANEDYNRLGIEKGGSNFFATSRRNIVRDIYPEDQEKILSVFTKKQIMEYLERDGVFTLEYRLIIGEKPTYVRLKVTRMRQQDARYVIVGVSNIDAQMRRERELRASQEEADRDILTGVKNRHAYMEEVDRRNREIQEKQADPFTVLVCDVDGLKAVNDTAGYRAGDILIQAASRSLSQTFRNSSVYRIGGDEFAVIGSSADQAHLDDLLQGLAEQNASQGSGGLCMTCGHARYQPEKDASFADVFARADARMAENKALRKQPGLPPS